MIEFNSELDIIDYLKCNDLLYKFLLFLVNSLIISGLYYCDFFRLTFVDSNNKTPLYKEISCL